VARETPLSRGLRLSALLLVAVVVAARPLFAGTPADFLLTTVLAAVLLLALALTIVSRSLGRGLPVLGTPLHPALLLFTVAALWGVAKGGWQPEAVLRGLDYLSLFIILLLVVELSGELQARQLFLFLVLTGFFVAVVYGLYQNFYQFSEMAEAIREHPDQVARELSIAPEEWPDFISRFESGEIWSTFIMSNTFGGYLIILLPVLAGYFFDYIRATRNVTERTSSIAYLVMAVAGFWALALTGSRGAWVAVGGALVLGPALILSWKRLRRAWPVLVVVLCVAGGSLFHRLAHADIGARVLLNDSIGARLGYWQGTVRVIGRHPIAGVGIDRFPGYYLQEKIPSAHEVDLPHNMWLEAWVEMGLLGLVALVAVAATGLWMALEAVSRPGDSEPTTPVPRASPCLYAGAAGLVAFVTVCRLGGGWTGALAWALGGLWLATSLFFVYSAPDRVLARAGTGVRWGLVIGLLAFLLHGSIDIDLYSPAITTTVVVLLATVGAELPHSSRMIRIPFWAAVGLTALSLVMVGGFARRVVPAIVEGESLEQLARYHLFQGRLSEAKEELERALKANPRDATAVRYLAGIYAGEATAFGGQQDLFRKAQELWQRFITLRPASFQGYNHLGRLYFRWASLIPAENREEKRRYLEQAEAQYRKAVTRYPTLPLLHLELGRLYQELGKNEQAEQEYKEALRLGPLIVQHIRKLSAEQLEEINRRLRELREANRPAPVP